MFAAIVSSLALVAAPALALAQTEPAPPPPAPEATTAPTPAQAQQEPSLDDAINQATSQQPTVAAPGAPVSTGDDPNAQAQADALAKGEAPFPAGAPTDDYGLVGWCYGALQGHMALYKQVMPEVERIERAFPDPAVPIDEALKAYADQHAEGTKALKRYAAALDAADKREPGAHAAARPASISLGHDAWKGATTADARTLAQLWMSWELPSRCETTAQRLAAAGQ